MVKFNDLHSNYGLPEGVSPEQIVNGAIVKVTWNDRTTTRILITDAWQIVRQRGTLEQYKVKGFDLNDMKEREIPLSIISGFVCGPRTLLTHLSGLH